MNYSYYKVNTNKTLLKKLNTVRTIYESFINEYVSNYENMLSVNRKPVKPISTYDYIKYLISDNTITAISSRHNNRCSIKSINPYNLFVDINDKYVILNKFYNNFNGSDFSIGRLKNEIRKVDKYGVSHPLKRLYIGVKDISMIDRSTIFIKKIGIIHLEKELPKSFNGSMRNCISYAIIIFDEYDEENIQIMVNIRSNILLGSNPLVIGYSPNGIGLMAACSTPLIGTNTRVLIRDPLTKVKYREACNNYDIASTIPNNIDSKGIINIDNIDTVHLSLPFVNFIKSLNRSNLDTELKISLINTMIRDLGNYKEKLADKIIADRIDAMLSKVNLVYDSIYIISPSKETIDRVISDDNKRKLIQFNARHVAELLKNVPEFNKLQIDIVTVYNSSAYAKAINEEIPEQRELLHEFLMSVIE